MPVLSVNQVTTFRWNFEEDIRRYSEHDIPAIGVWRCKLDEQPFADAAYLLKQHDMTVSNLAWAGGFTGSDGQTFSEAINDAVEAIQMAALLDAGSLTIHSGGRTRHTLNYAKRLFRDAMRELLPIAEDFDVTLAVEPMHPSCASDFTWMNSIESFLAFYDSLDCDRLRLILDTYHIGWTPRSLDRIVEVAPLIAMVQLGDVRQPIRGEQNRCMLGEGLVPLQEIADALNSAGYDGYYDMELLGRDMDPYSYTARLEHAKKMYDELVGMPDMSLEA